MATASEAWMDELGQTVKRQPTIRPEIGVTITCRIVVSSFEHWHYVQEALDACRQYGSGEITDYKEFEP